MSYREPTVTTNKGVFYAYRSTSIVISTANTQIPLTDTSAGNSIVGGAVNFGGVRKTYCTGEIRETAGTQYQLGEIYIATNDGETSEGYQVRNNAAGAYLMDDACYAVTSQSSVALYVGNILSARNIASEPDETRIIGVFTS